jgi:potassium efflux system protein
MQLNISDLLWAFSKKLALFWLVFGLCWKVLEKDGVAVNHFNMPAQLTSHWRRQIVRVSLALLPLHFWSVVAELSPLHLMDDVLGQFVILLNLLVIAILMWPMCRDSWRDKESHSIRLATVTVLSIIPVALMVLTATGYFYTTLRLSGRWIETVYLVILWNLLYQTVLRGLSVAARRIAYRRALARRQNMVKEGAEGAEPQEEPTIALEQVNQQTLRITMLVMIALFGVMFWAIWSDLITVFAYLDSITLWHYSGTEAGGFGGSGLGLDPQPARPAGSAGTLAPEYAPGGLLRHYHHSELCDSGGGRDDRLRFARGLVGQTAVAGGGSVGRSWVRFTGDLW